MSGNRKGILIVFLVQISGNGYIELSNSFNHFQNYYPPNINWVRKHRRQDRGQRTLNREHRTENAGQKTMSIEQRTLNREHRAENTGQRTQNTEQRTLNTGQRTRHREQIIKGFSEGILIWKNIYPIFGVVF